MSFDKSVSVNKYDTSLSVAFYIEHDEVMRIGENMQELNSAAYMNGYNWEAFIKYYVENYLPEVKEGMGTDPEAGMYVAYYDLTIENEKKAEKLAEAIKNLLDNEDKIYEIVKNEGDKIEWD